MGSARNQGVVFEQGAPPCVPKNMPAATGGCLYHVLVEIFVTGRGPQQTYITGYIPFLLYSVIRYPPRTQGFSSS